MMFKEPFQPKLFWVHKSIATHRWSSEMLIPCSWDCHCPNELICDWFSIFKLSCSLFFHSQSKYCWFKISSLHFPGCSLEASRVPFAGKDTPNKCRAKSISVCNNALTFVKRLKSGHFNCAAEASLQGNHILIVLCLDKGWDTWAQFGPEPALCFVASCWWNSGCRSPLSSVQCLHSSYLHRGWWATAASPWHTWPRESLLAAIEKA